MTPITKLLVANRGEIALRIMRTARRLDIATVAVHSDADAGAPFVADADEAVRLPGEAPSDTYLRVDRIVAAARRTGADAVHPGYGFLSERAELARACLEAGLVFVGPSAEAIEAMGSKVVAKERMAAAGVPVLPAVVVDRAGPDAELADRAEAEVGFPLLVKATHGGGGRGMRVVRHPSDLAGAVDAARREAVSAFGSGDLFLERYVESPRHIEVQIVGDAQGTVVHLFERECSIQRRYQKVLEEAPSPLVDEAMRTMLGDAAVAAGKAVGYVGAGTVEFVVDQGRRFAFLEMNTRLQVEHPVTELVTGLDLVQLQLLVAEGRPLPEEVLGARLTGHAIEARLYAERVAAGYLPATGTVHRFRVPALAGVRVDAGVADGSVVGVHYDSMLAKVVAFGATRDEARRLLARALDEAQVHGVTTNRDLLVGILREPDFAAGELDTGYLDRHDLGELCRSRHAPGALAVHALAAALAAQAERRTAAPVLATLPSGWRNVRGQPQQVSYEVDGQAVEVRYDLGTAWRGTAGSGTAADGTAERAPGAAGTPLVVEVDGHSLAGAVLLAAAPDRVELEVDGVRRTVSVHRVGATAYVDSVLGTTVLGEVPRFPAAKEVGVPGSLLAPMPGTVMRVNVEPGQHVTAGTVVVVLEAMKMEQPVVAPHDGTVAEVPAQVGRTVDVGAVLVVVDEAAGAGEPATGEAGG